jgi:hypothetical protein
VFWPRSEPAFTNFEADTVFRALSDIRRMCSQILAILEEDDDGEAEADEP